MRKLMKSLSVHFGGFTLTCSPFRLYPIQILVFLALSFFGRFQLRKSNIFNANEQFNRQVEYIIMQIDDIVDEFENRG